jgi:hypothetical protein
MQEKVKISARVDADIRDKLNKMYVNCLIANKKKTFSCIVSEAINDLYEKIEANKENDE